MQQLDNYDYQYYEDDHSYSNSNSNNSTNTQPTIVALIKQIKTPPGQTERESTKQGGLSIQNKYTDSSK